MPHILIMEDNVLLSYEWKEAFELNQFTVTLTHNGVDAIALLGSESFDFVVTDLFVSGSKGGPSVIQAVQQLGKKAPPIIAVTGVPSELSGDRNNNMFLEQARRFGASAVMEKPFSALELVSLVQSKLQEGRS